jgi:hypothetical protein
MDLDDWGRRDLGAALIAAYVRDSGDLEAYAPLPFYQCYRAMVRCKVAVIRHRAEAGEGSASTPWSREAERYLRLAHDYALRYSRPTIWAVLGVPASGKSTMARGLAEALSVDVLSSDVVRKRIFGLAPTEAAATSPDRGIYSPEATRRTYAELLGSARRAIAEGRSVVLDATFGSEGHRREVRELAGGRAVPVRFVLCTAPKEVLLSRLGERRDGESVSDARPRHFDALRRRFEPVSGEGANLFQADTVRSLDACLRGILDWDYRLPVEPSEQQWACPPANTGG